MSVNLEGIDVFVKVASLGSFARAAEQLAITRSAVGKIVARLEERLGVRLFHRTTRSLYLTSEGQIYYERCLIAIRELETGESLLESGKIEVNGKLKVSMPVLFGRYCAGPALLSLAAQHQELELECHFTDRVVDIINEGYDLVVRFSSSDLPVNLESRHIASQRKIACASPAYLNLRGVPTSLSDLKHHEALVSWHNGQIMPWQYLDENNQIISPELNWRLQFDDYQMIADAAVRGMGIAWLPSWLVQDHINAGDLFPLFGQLPTPLFHTYAVWPGSSFHPMKLKAAIEILTEKLQWVSAC